MKIRYLLALYFISQSTFAFLNIEALRQSKSSDKRLTGSTQMGASDKNGNVNKTLFSASSLNMMNMGHSNYIILGSYNYGKSTGVEDTNDGHFHIRYTRKFSEVLFGEIYQQTEFDKFQDLNSRLLLGVGPRFKLFQEQKHALFLGTGVFYEREELQNDPEQKNPRGNIYLSYVFNKKKEYSASIVAYYQPNLEKISDRRVKLSIGLESSLGKHFFQQWSYSLSHDSAPPTGVYKTDGQVAAKIGVRY